ncbi:MAG: xanthine dehydrogenase family protein subunit M [Chloroflexi bacterium]|nr:xanthine dehydrogenase family protein subunit M [Chloroflexota bacterium]MBV9896481.1 xanthine dehydrogenase family protein subunit M [Chloroflexota bacterium]
MKPAPFEYVAPRSIDEAVTALARGGSEAKVLAGGQSLIPLLNFRLARPTLLVDLNRIPELAHITPRNGGVGIGAMTRQVTVERNADLGRSQPLLKDAIGWVGHAAIRSRGTIGGSLAHADPAAELPAVAVCLDARMRAVSPRGSREIASEAFFQGYLTTVLEPDEILVETWLPALQPNTGQAWLEFARRHGDFALVGVAASITLRRELVQDARIVLTGVGGKPVRVREAETLLVGGTVEDRVGAAADAARTAIEPEADIHASKEYRAHLAGVLTDRAVRLAYERAATVPGAALDTRRTLEAGQRRA